MIKYPNGVSRMKSVVGSFRGGPGRQFQTMLLYLHGAAGTRKSQFCRLNWPEGAFCTLNNGFFAGYSGQNVMILDDVDIKEFSSSLLKLLGNHVPYQLNCKGSFVSLNAAIIVIIQNMGFDEFVRTAGPHNGIDKEAASRFEGRLNRGAVVEFKNQQVALDLPVWCSGHGPKMGCLIPIPQPSNIDFLKFVHGESLSDVAVTLDAGALLEQDAISHLVSPKHKKKRVRFNLAGELAALSSTSSVPGFNAPFQWQPPDDSAESEVDCPECDFGVLEDGDVMCALCREIENEQLAHVSKRHRNELIDDEVEVAEDEDY